MIRVTLDTNCIIKALNPDENDHALAKQLIAMHKPGSIEIQVVAANASENGRNFERLRKELGRLSLKGITILPIPLILDFSHLGHTYLVDDNLVNDLKQTWYTLFSGSAFEHDAFCRQKHITILKPGNIDKRWHNQMCDTLTVFEYIKDCKQHSNPEDVNILTSSDSDDILKRVEKLQELGASEIYDIPQTINRINQLLPQNP